MIKVSLRGSFFLLALLALSVGTARAGDSAVLKAVEDAFKAHDLARALQLAEPALADEKDTATLVRLRYLSGKSLFEQTATDIRACREDGTLQKGMLRPDQADAMKKAIVHFQAVYDLDPDNPLAPESLFMAGRILDYGCLNHFAEAIVQYDICRKRYSDNQYGKLAEARYQKLKPRLETGSHGHGGQ